MFRSIHGPIGRLLCQRLRDLGTVVIAVTVGLFIGQAVVAADDAEADGNSNWIAARGELLTRATTCLEQRDALCLLRQAKAAARWVEDRESLDWLNGLRARGYAEQGYFNLAREAVAAIEDDVLRADALGAIAGVAAERGDRDEALDLLSEADASLEGERWDFAHVEALAVIGWAHAKLGDEHRASTFWRVAKAMWNELGAPPEQSGTIYELAWGKIDTGATSDALSDIEWLDRQVPAPENLLKPFRLVGHTDENGVLHLTQIPAGEPVARVYAAVLYAFAGLREQAETAIASVEDLVADWESLQDDEILLETIVRAQAALGRVDDALATARSIGTTYGQVRAYCRIAIEQREVGTLHTSAQALELVEPLIRNLEDPEEIATITIRLANALK